MPQVEADLVIAVNQSQTNITSLINGLNTVGKKVNEVKGISINSFKQISQNVTQTNANLNKSVGILSQLRLKIEDLRQQRELATTAADAEKLTEAIRKTELQVGQLEGRLDAFGQRQKRGLNELSETFLNVGQGVVGVINVIGILGATGEKENEALIAATKALVIAESIRAAVVGFLKFQELAASVATKLRTKATVEQAVVSETATVATGAQATATTGLAVAEGEATVATKELTVAMLANPWFLLAAAVVAVVGALIIFGDESEKITDKMIKDKEKELDLNNSLADSRQKSLDAELNYLRSIGAITAAQASRKQEEKKVADEEIKIQKEKNLELLKEEQRFQKERSSFHFVTTGRALVPVAGPTAKEVAENAENIERITTDFNGRLDALQSSHEFNMLQITREGNKEILEEDSRLANLRISLIRNSLDKAIQERRQKAKEEEDAILPAEKNREEKIKLIRQKAAQDILDIQEKFQQQAIDNLLRQAEAERAINDRILSGEADFGTNMEKLEEQQNKSRSDLQAEQVKLLTDREREIREEGKNLGLATAQIEANVQAGIIKINNQFHKLFAIQEIAFGKQREKVSTDNAVAILNLQRESLEKRLAIFDEEFKAIAEKLKEQGATEQQIEAARVQGRNKALIDAENARLTALNNIRKDNIDAVEAQAGEEIELEKHKNLEKLESDLDLAEEQLTLLQLFGDKQDIATQQQIAAIQAAITKIKGEIKKAKADIVPFTFADFFADIFNIPVEFRQQFVEGFNSIFSSINSIMSDNVDGQIRSIEAALDANKELIDSLKDAIAEAEDKVEKEEELNRRGLANNLNLEQQRLAALRAQREKELAQQKSLQAERIKLAKEQQRIESLTQASAIVTAGVNLIKTWSTLPFGVGLVLAFAQVAGIIAFVSSLRNRSDQATASLGFGTGGYTGDGNPRKEAGVVHRKEFVFNEEKTTELRDVFEKIHRDQPLTNDDVNQLLQGTGITMSEPERKKIVRSNKELVIADTQAKHTNLEFMREKMDTLIERTETIEQNMSNGTDRYFEPDGTEVETTRRGNITTVKRIKRG